MAVDITGLSLVVAEMLGVSEAFGGAFVTMGVLIVCILTATTIQKKALETNFFLVLTFFVMGLGTLAGWIDYWWLLAVIGLIAIFGSLKIGGKQ